MKWRVMFELVGPYHELASAGDILPARPARVLHDDISVYFVAHTRLPGMTFNKPVACVTGLDQAHDGFDQGEGRGA